MTLNLRYSVTLPGEYLLGSSRQGLVFAMGGEYGTALVREQSWGSFHQLLLPK